MTHTSNGPIPTKMDVTAESLRDKILDIAEGLLSSEDVKGQMKEIMAHCEDLLKVYDYQLCDETKTLKFPDKEKLEENLERYVQKQVLSTGNPDNPYQAYTALVSAARNLVEASHCTKAPNYDTNIQEIPQYLEAGTPLDTYKPDLSEYLNPEDKQRYQLSQSREIHFDYVKGCVEAVRETAAACYIMEKTVAGMIPDAPTPTPDSSIQDTAHQETISGNQEHIAL